MNPLDIVGAISAPITALIDRLVPDKNQADREKANMETLLVGALVTSAGQQAAVNAAEAQHPSVFVAGWRPAVGWLCVFVLAYAYVLRDLLTFALQAFAPDLPPLPPFPMDNIMDLLFGLLGLAGMRTVEKKWGIATVATGSKKP